MANPLCHFEFLTDDVEKCQRFYNTVFEWSFDSNVMPDYTVVRTGRDPSGGIMTTPNDVTGPRMTAYFMVADIGATLEKIVAAGGTVLKPEEPIPHIGSFALFSDPDGNVLGLLRPH